MKEVIKIFNRDMVKVYLSKDEILYLYRLLVECSAPYVHHKSISKADYRILDYKLMDVIRKNGWKASFYPKVNFDVVFKED